MKWSGLLVAVYLFVVALILPPTGSATFTDDWDFSASALDLVRTGHLRLSDFPSMTLVTHLIWGAIFASAIGPTLLALRISTMVMAWIGALSLQSLAQRKGVPARRAAILSALYLFCPPVFFSSFTFLTDVAGCSLTLLFLALADSRAFVFEHAKDKCMIRRRFRLSYAALFGSVAAAGYLARQTILIPVIALVLLSIPQLLRRRLDGMACAVALAVFAAPVITYWWWIDYVHGVPVNFEIELLRPEQLLWPKVVVMKVIRIALTIGFFTAPVTVGLLITRLFSSGHRPVALRWMTLSIALSLSLFLLTPLHDARLYWGITSVDQNMGNVPPVTGLSQALIPETINRPLLGGLLNLSVSRFDLCVIPLSTLSIVTLAGITLQHLFATVSTGTTRDGIDDSRLALWIRRAIHVLSDGLKIATMSIALLTFLGHFLLILMIWNIFDRYPAPLLSVTLVLLIPMLRQPFGKPDDERGKVVGDVKRRESMRRSAWTLDLLCAAGVLTMATYAIVYTHDYRVMWQSVWDAAGSLQDSGVAADEIELGWAYLGSTIYRRNLAVAFGDEAVTIGDFTFAQRERFFQRVGEVRYFFAISTPNIDANIKPVHTCKPATWLRTPMLVLYRIPAGEAE